DDPPWAWGDPSSSAHRTALVTTRATCARRKRDTATGESSSPRLGIRESDARRIESRECGPDDASTPDPEREKRNDETFPGRVGGGHRLCGGLALGSLGHCSRGHTDAAGRRARDVRRRDAALRPLPA